MLRSSSIFKRNGANLVEKNYVWKKTRIVHSQFLNTLNMQKTFFIVSSFEDMKFTINEKYFKKYYDNSNYYVFLVVFQT